MKENLSNNQCFNQFPYQFLITIWCKVPIRNDLVVAYYS